MKKMKDTLIDRDNLWPVINNLTGIDLDKEDLTDEVILRSIVFLKLNEIEYQFDKDGVALEFTSNVSDLIITKLRSAKYPLKILSKYLKENIFKFLLNKEAKDRFKQRSKHIIDILDEKLIFRQSIAFELD